MCCKVTQNRVFLQLSVLLTSLRENSQLDLKRDEFTYLQMNKQQSMYISYENIHPRSAQASINLFFFIMLFPNITEISQMRWALFEITRTTLQLSSTK